MRPSKSDRGSETREQLLITAERLFAEHGVEAVSNRQVSEAAGQSNNFAVGYHFGSKDELVLAIVRRHAESVERRRVEMFEKLAGSTDLRDWVSCLVRPTIEHLESLGGPTWYARFIAQVTTNPTLRERVTQEAFASSTLQRLVEGMFRLVPRLPEHVHQQRGVMCRLLIVQLCAERERELQQGTAAPHATWAATADVLVDALVGLWLAPDTSRR
ncbi:TetR/AcrR family transcriptional regulator [Melittangium boletus]|uniref:TetR/AcrR family transcriptional regulator n=1 Tax=Melittangium boletus TaxID=83453 RepID=UPI003DA39A77